MAIRSNISDIIAEWFLRETESYIILEQPNVCRMCGAPITMPGQKFCTKCGASFTGKEAKSGTGKEQPGLARSGEHSNLTNVLRIIAKSPQPGKEAQKVLEYFKQHNRLPGVRKKAKPEAKPEAKPVSISGQKDFDPEKTMNFEAGSPEYEQYMEKLKSMISPADKAEELFKKWLGSLAPGRLSAVKKRLSRMDPKEVKLWKDKIASAMS